MESRRVFFVAQVASVQARRRLKLVDIVSEEDSDMSFGRCEIFSVYSLWEKSTNPPDVHVPDVPPTPPER